jgi:8-oxo-dGTP pyrophosphatase MutT (NUDIX family)
MTEHNKIKNENNEIIKAGCVVVNEKSEVLLVSDKEGKIWSFPKGHAKEGETLEQVAFREVQEETGYEVDIIKRLSDLTYTHGKTGELIRVAMFKAKPIRELEKHLDDGEKYSQSIWFARNEAKKVIYHNLSFLLDEI